MILRQRAGGNGKHARNSGKRDAEEVCIAPVSPARKAHERLVLLLVVAYLYLVGSSPLKAIPGGAFHVGCWVLGVLKSVDGY
jgi:hypothetical protein